MIYVSVVVYNCVLVVKSGYTTRQMFLHASTTTCCNVSCWQSSRPWHVQCTWCHRKSLHWSESIVDSTQRQRHQWMVPNLRHHARYRDTLWSFVSESASHFFTTSYLVRNMKNRAWTVFNIPCWMQNEKNGTRHCFSFSMCLLLFLLVFCDFFWYFVLCLCGE